MAQSMQQVTCLWRKSNGSIEPDPRPFVDIKRLEIRNSTLLMIPYRMFSNFSKLLIFRARDAKIQEIHGSDFEAADSLYLLDLSKNLIRKLEARMFSNLKGIKEIDLSQNNLEAIDDAAFEGMGINFTRIDLSGNKIKVFKEDFFLSMISNSTRKWLPFDVNLRMNEIENIEPSERDPVVIPEFNIQLSGNKIKNLELLKIEIFELILKNSSLESLNVNASYITVDNNKIKTYRLKGKTRSLNIQNNSISSLTYDDFLSVPRLINLAGNNLTADAIYDLLKKTLFLEVLDISRNPIKSLKIDMFSELVMLQKLMMRNIGLNELPFGVFGYQNNLKLLDISFNNLSNIDFHVFSSNVNLEVLDLSGTNITKIKDCKKIGELLPKLKLVGVEENNWKCEVLSKLKACMNSQYIKFLIPDRPTKTESNIMGIKCTYAPNDTTVNSSLSSNVTGLFAIGIMTKIKELDDKITAAKVPQHSQGITSSELILSVLLSVALTVFLMYGINKLRNRFQMSRFRMPNFSRRDSPDTIVTYDSNQGR